MKIILCILFIVAATGAAAQEIFRGIDDKGVFIYTDNPYRLEGSQPESWPPAVDRDALYESQLSKQMVIPYRKADKAIRIQGVLNGTLPVTFILDTGASLTQITREDAKRLRITPDPEDRVRIRLADGRIVGIPRVRVHSLRVGSVELRNVETLVGEARLLGLNFLKAFHMMMDAEKGQLVLDPISKPR